MKTFIIAILLCSVPVKAKDPTPTALTKPWLYAFTVIANDGTTYEVNGGVILAKDDDDVLIEVYKWAHENWKGDKWSFKPPMIIRIDPNLVKRCRQASP